MRVTPSGPGLEILHAYVKTIQSTIFIPKVSKARNGLGFRLDPATFKPNLQKCHHFGPRVCAVPGSKLGFIAKFNEVFFLVSFCSKLGLTDRGRKRGILNYLFCA